MHNAELFDETGTLVSYHPSVKCLHPIILPVTGDDYYQKYGRQYVPITVPCGHCVLCTKRRRREWSLRVIMEAQEYPNDQIYHVTLTYANEFLPQFIAALRPPYRLKSTLFADDLRNFMKRLRRRLSYKIRFYACGEYGTNPTKTHRPHYHVVLFGIQPKDLHFIEDAWKRGIVHIKNFFNETAGYVAGYVQKKLFGTDVYDSQVPPFMRCSQNPPIGYEFFERDIDKICKQGFIVWKDFKYPIPRSFSRKAVEKGYLPECDLDELAFLQNMYLTDWLDHMEAQGVEAPDYIKNHFLIAMHEYTRMNVSRELSEVS